MKNSKLSSVIMILLTVQTMAESKEPRTWQQAAYDNRYGIAAGAAAVGIGTLGYAYSDEIAEFLKLPAHEQQKSIQDNLQDIQEEQAKIYTKEQKLAEEIRLAKEQRVAETARFEQEKIRLKNEVQRAEQQRQVEVSRLEQEKAELEAKNTANFYNNVAFGIGGAIAGGAAIGLNESHKQKIEKEKQQLERDKEKKIMRQLHNEVESAQKSLGELSAENATYKKQLPKKLPTPEIATEEVQLNCDVAGYPTINAIQDLIQKEYFPNLTNKQLQVSTASKGGLSEKIYCVSIDNTPVFFLKISTERTQAAIQKQLTALQASHIGRISILQKYAQAFKRDIHTKLPIIILMEKFYVYTKPSGDKATIELMHAAKGKELLSMLTNSSIIEKQWIVAVGASLGAFQQIFMQYNNSDNPEDWKTVAHKDLNLRNIFYDEAKNQVYFIDNADMNDGQSIRNDREEIIRTLKDVFDRQLQRNDIADTLIDWFLQGYLNSFQRYQRDILIKTYFPQYSQSITPTP